METVGRAILLLAGRGRRLGALTADRPKCMVEVNGEPILGRMLRLLASSDVGEAVLVVGYREDQVRAFAGDRFEGMDVRYVVNERHSETNTAYSLWLARRYLDRDLFLLEGDIVFEASALARLLSIGAGASGWAAVPVGPGRDEGILLAGEDDGRVYGVELVREPAGRCASLGHKCAGIQLLDSGTARAFAAALDRAVGSGGTRVFADLVLAGMLADRPVRLCSLNGARWAEIDDPLDLARARRIFASDSPSLQVASDAG